MFITSNDTIYAIISFDDVPAKHFLQKENFPSETAQDKADD